MTAEPTVFVVDDDESVCTSTCALVNSMGHRAEAFHSAEEFLDAYDPDRPGCLVTDVRMPGMSGMDLQEKLMEERVKLPIVVITAFAEVPLAVRALKSGAVTLLEKPCKPNELLQSIRDALSQDSKARAAQSRRQAIRDRLARLTPQERLVLDLMCAGKLNKVIARELGIAVRTVELRRHNVFAKMEADSVADLVRLAMEAEGEETETPPLFPTADEAVV